ncbi:enoyl-CoA hydratase-related protein [Streptomyces sp900116325]|uniref:enoyl-CoA hydratase-related protein n=1 Tax=Streptomyces sp. 900116325 TaxID=3154295 RepID=UPI0033BD57C1
MPTITLNRPARKNAVDHEVAARLVSASDQLDADPELSVGVLTGAGGVFSHLPPSPRPTPRSSDQP